MARALDCTSQLALLTLGQAGSLARLNLSVLIDIALQGFEVLVVKIGYVGSMFKNLRQFTIPFLLNKSF